jgi:hypothetical protein
MKILLGVLSVDVLVFLIFSATALFGGSGPTEPSAAHARRSSVPTAAPRWSTRAVPTKTSSARSACRT